MIQPGGLSTRKMSHRSARRGPSQTYISAYKVLLRARSNLIWDVKCMYVRCEPSKYVYGTSMRSQREIIYVAIIIGVDVMVYAACKCGRRFNPSPIHIKRVRFVKVLEVLCEIDVRGVQIGSPKFRGVLCESNTCRVSVVFTQIQGFS